MWARWHCGGSKRDARRRISSSMPLTPSTGCSCRPHGLWRTCCLRSSRCYKTRASEFALVWSRLRIRRADPLPTDPTTTLPTLTLFLANRLAPQWNSFRRASNVRSPGRAWSSHRQWRRRGRTLVTLPAWSQGWLSDTAVGMGRANFGLLCGGSASHGGCDGRVMPLCTDIIWPSQLVHRQNHELRCAMFWGPMLVNAK